MQHWRSALILALRPGQQCSPSCYQLLIPQRHLSSNSAATHHSSSCVYEDDQHPLRPEDLPHAVWRTMQELRAAGEGALCAVSALVYTSVRPQP